MREKIIQVLWVENDPMIHRLIHVKLICGKALK